MLSGAKLKMLETQEKVYLFSYPSSEVKAPIYVKLNSTLLWNYIRNETFEPLTHLEPLTEFEPLI